VDGGVGPHNENRCGRGLVADAACSIIRSFTKLAVRGKRPARVVIQGMVLLRVTRRTTIVNLLTRT
jgi:hypothetical protein